MRRTKILISVLLVLLLFSVADLTLEAQFHATPADGSVFGPGTSSQVRFGTQAARMTGIINGRQANNQNSVDRWLQPTILNVCR
jgi:hypothetical protein